MPTFAEVYAEHPEAAPPTKRGHQEHNLQTKLVAFCREYIAVPHEFAAHDRSENHGGKQHLWEAKRGIRRSWPDIELALQGGRTIRCELKAAGKKLMPGSDQERLAERLNALGHVTFWANTATMFLHFARLSDVPFRPGADARAAAIDTVLTAATSKPATASKPRAARVPTSRIRAVERVRARSGGLF